MKVEEVVFCKLDGDDYQDLDNLMSRAFIAGKNDTKDKNNEEFTVSIESLHNEVKELIQQSFDKGRNYEKSRFG